MLLRHPLTCSGYQRLPGLWARCCLATAQSGWEVPAAGCTGVLPRSSPAQMALSKEKQPHHCWDKNPLAPSLPHWLQGGPVAPFSPPASPQEQSMCQRQVPRGPDLPMPMTWAGSICLGVGWALARRGTLAVGVRMMPACAGRLMALAAGAQLTLAAGAGPPQSPEAMVGRGVLPPIIPA